MTFHDPFLLSVIGALIVIFSTVITEIFITKNERKVQELESEILELNLLQSGARDANQRSVEAFRSNELTLLIIQLHALTNKDGIDFSKIQENVFKGFFYGLVESYTSAKGKGPDDKILHEFESICIKGILSMREISKLKDDFLSEWVSRHNDIGKKKSKKEELITNFYQKTRILKRVSFSLQLIGLIVVLVKDVAIKV